MTQTTYTATEARQKFAEIFNQALYGDPVVIDKQGKKVAVIPLELLDRLAELEAQIESKKAQKALDEFQSQGGRPMEDLEEELGLS